MAYLESEIEAGVVADAEVAVTAAEAVATAVPAAVACMLKIYGTIVMSNPMYTHWYIEFSQYARIFKRRGRQNKKVASLTARRRCWKLCLS